MQVYQAQIYGETYTWLAHVRYIPVVGRLQGREDILAKAAQ